jgi:protein-S-isoprenylcysteine O-methyltransferase Ste14
VAGVVWFILLAVLALRGTLNLVNDLSAGASLARIAPQMATRACVVAFYAVTVWLLLVRPAPRAQRGGVAPVTAAMLGTYISCLAPLLPSAPAAPGREVVAAVVALVGEVLMVLTLLRLGRSFSIVPQARVLVTSGPYRFVRHPLYLTEEIAVIGILLTHVWWAAVPFFLAHLALQIRRMLYEEALLRGVFPDYAAYARRTARLIPGVW